MPFTQMCMCVLEKLVGFCKDFLCTASSISLIVAAKVNERSMLHISFSCKLHVCVGTYLKLYSWVKNPKLLTTAFSFGFIY